MTSPHDEHDDALGKSLADRFRDGDTSDEPVTPVEPEITETPVEPETPETPDETVTPETPVDTETQETPVEPETPVTPETPTPATPVSSLQDRLTSDTYEPPVQQPHTTYEKNPYTPTPHHQGGYPPQNPAPDYSSPTYPQRTQDWGEYHDPFPSSTVPQAYANAGAHPVEPYGYGQVQYQGDDEQKSMLLAFLLAFFTGPFGIHNFYLGYTGRAVTQLILTLVGLVTAIILVGFLFLLVTMVWATVDWIMILVDKNYKDADGKNLDRG